MSKPVLLLIDSHAIIHRAYHAFPPTLRTTKGEQVNAVYGFTSILLEVLQKFHPEYLACAFDSPGPTQRHDMFVEYKIHRPKPDDEFLSQLPRINDVVEAINIPVFRVPGFEADDILGTIANKNYTDKNGEKVEIIIATGDKDLLQLVRPGVKVYISATGNRFAKSILYDEEEVKKRMGFAPALVVDYKSLRGDPSDNIPGVAGIGEKTATNLIQEYGTLEEIFAQIGKIPEKVRKKLENEYEIAQMSKQLATIIRDVPLSFDLEKAKLSDYDPNRVRKLFMELEFKSLLRKLPVSDNKIEIQSSMFPTNSSTDFTYERIDNNEELAKFLELLSRQNIFAFDTETTGLDSYSAKTIGMSFSWEDLHAYFVDLRNFKPGESQLKLIREIFNDPAKRIVAHNMKFDAHALLSRTPGGDFLNAPISNYFFDTLLAGYVLFGGQNGNGLKRLAFSRLGIEMDEIETVWATCPGFKQKKSYNSQEIENFMLNCDSEKLAKYASNDARVTWLLYKHFDALFRESEKKLQNLFFDIEMPIVKILVEIEQTGISLDSKYLKKYGEELKQKLSKLEKSIYREIGHEFNINSPKQVGEVLFNELNLPGAKHTKTGAWQTNERILLNLRSSVPVVDYLLQYRELSKLNSTYIDTLIAQIDEKSNRVHTNYNQAITSTGRLSSSNPNLQNIPVATEEGIKIRQAFVPAKGYKFISFDFSQQELRLLAHMSGEPALLGAYKQNEDVHALTASKIFEVPLEKVTRAQRATGKTLNFSLIYGISAFGLSDRLKIPREQAQEFIDNFFLFYPKVKEYFDQLLENARVTGKVETMFGRYRDTSGLNNSNFAIRSATEREVINFPIQGSAADMMKIAMINCQEYVKKSKECIQLDLRMILQVHDELIFEVISNGLEDYGSTLNVVMSKIKSIMENAVKLDVPVVVGVSEGKNWGELK